MKYLKNFPKILSFVLTFSLALSLTTVFAADLSLTKIGGLDTTDKNYSEWWYKGASPTLLGTAQDGTDVSIVINDTTYTTTVLNEVWSYQTSLEDTDYQVSISQGEQNIAFTLHMGQELPINATGTTTESTSSVPDTGFNQYVAGGLGIGVILLASYFYISEDTKRKTVFETRLIKEN